MASSFLKKKAEAQAKKIDEKYGESAYGGSSTLRSGTQAASSAQTSVPAFNGGGGGSSTRTRASNFLTRKAREAAEGIDKEYGADQYGGSSWTALDKESGFNTWLDELTGFSSKVGEDYSARDGSYQSADILGSYRDEKNTDIEVMLNRANIYKDYFSENMSYYDELYGEGATAEILRSIDEGSKYLGDVRTDLDSEYNYWSQWETEDDYNGYLEQAAEYERLSSYDVEGGKSNLEVLGAQRSDLWAKKQAEQQKISAYSRAGNMPTQLKEAREAFASYDSQISALDDQISGLQQELQRAEDIQTANRYTAYMDEPDFSQYSKQGAAIENPALADVEKGVTIFGWNPFAEKPNNIVTYSRDNWGSIAMGEANNSQMTGRSLYHWMTDDEVNIYNYILSKQGNEAAQAYLDSIEETLNYRFGTMQAENIQNIGGVGEALLTGLYGLGSGLDQFGTGVRQLFSSDRLPTTATQFGSAAIEEDLGGVGKVLYGGTKMVGNMAPGLLLAAVTAGVGAPVAVSGGVLSASVGASAGGNAYNQALGDGYTKEQARTYGSLVGLSEGALTYLLGGLGKTTGLTSKMLGKVASIDNALLRIAATGGVRIGGEVIEENLQNYLEPAFRTLIFDEEYDAPTFDDFVYTTLVTALTVGILEGGSIASAGRSQSTDLAVRDFTTDTIDGYLGEDGVDYFEGITDESELQSKYRELAKVNHPDVGGSEQTMTDINRQYAMRRAFYTVATQTVESSAPTATTQKAPSATAETTGTQSDADLTVRLVREGVDRGAADSIASSIQSIVRGEEISGNKAAEIAQNEAAVTMLSELTGIEINTDAPISEVKTAIRNLASRTRAANSTGGGTDTSGTNEAQERIRRGYASKGERTVAVQAFDTERIGEIADTLGKAGAKALTSMYDATTQDAESYFEGMTAFYNAGASGKSISSVKSDTGSILTEAQTRAAYLAGQTDAQGSVSLAQKEKAGYTVDTNKTSETEVATDGGTEVHLRTGGERSDGTGAGGQVRAMAEGAGGNQGGQAQGRPADGGTASLTYGEKVSTASFGIANGSASKTVRRVTGGTTEAVTKAKALAKKRGLRLELFAGDNLTIGGRSVRACVIGDRVFARVDHPDFDAEQLVRHEVGHDMIDKGEIDPDTVRERLADTFTESELDDIAELYASAYNGMTAQEAWVELICDSLADMNIFSGTVLEGELGSKLGAIKGAATAELGEKSPRGPPAEKTSRDPEARRRALQRGEMQNRFKGKVNWPAYYEKLTRAEYNADNFDDGERTTMSLGGKMLIIEMQNNGEFSVIGIYDIKEGTYDTGLEENQKAPRRNHEGAEVPGVRDGDRDGRSGNGERQGSGGSRAVSDTGGGDGEKGGSQAGTAAAQQDDSGAGGELKASREVDGGAPVSQGISSAKTSIKQVPALFKDKNTRFGDTNIDIGGGRFDLATDYLASIGTQNMVFDPYNRTAKENTSTLSFLRGGERADTATCANVLNVIAEPAARANVILETAKAIKPDGTAYFMVYEGDGSGTGKETSAGWQNNRKTADYLSEIGEYFDSVQKKGKLIIATEPKKDLPKAAWEVTPGEAIMYSQEVDEKRLALAEMNAKYSALEKQGKEFESKPEHKQFMESIGKLKGDALDAAIEKYAAWERESGYAAVSKEMEELRGDIKDLRSDIERTEEREAKEAREEYRATYTEELSKKYASKAARKFGTTSRFDLAGYLTVNGSLLDFSDRQGYRVQDHREIADVLDFLPEEHGYSDGLIEFMNMGNIRLQSYGIDITKAPNKAQIPVLRRFFDSLGGEATIDFSNENGDSMGSVDYPEGTRSDRIIREINNYFETGTVPTVSDMQRFHYSEDVESLRDLREQNEELRDKVDYWKGQLKRTEPGTQTLRENDIDKLARNVLKGYGSELKAADIRADLKSLGEYILRGGDGKSELTYSEVKDRAVSIARDIVQNAYELVNNDEAETYRDIKAYFRGTYLSFEDKGDIADWADFRKRNFGRFTISKSGLPVDVAYQELTGMFGESYFPSEITHPTDQLLHIADLFDSMRPVYENPHSYYMAEAIEYCANEIIDGLISEDVRQTPPTFADRQAAKFGEQKAKDRQKLNDLREQKNERIEQIKTAGRERAKQAVAKERTRRQEQLASLKEHYRTKETRAREARRASALRNKIMRHVKELSGKLLKPTDKQHIPEALREPVARLLEAINLESQYTIDEETGGRVKGGEGLPTRRTKAFNALKEAYASVVGDVVVDPDLLGGDGVQGLLDEVIGMADIRLGDMNTAQLETVWQTVRAIEASIRTANKMFSARRFETVSEAADALRRDNDGKKQKAEYRFIGWAQKLTGLDMMTPEAFLHRLGPSGDDIFRMMRDAQDRHIRIMKAAADRTNEIVGKTKIRELEKELHTVTLGGQETTVSTAQIMELYVLMRREQAVEHILKGGILPEAVEGKGLKKVTTAEPIRGITLKELSSVFSLLNAEQTKLAERLQEYLSTELSEYGNAASMEVYGYKKFTEPRYWPIRSNKQETKSTVEKDTATTSIPNYGMTKTTRPNANTSVRVGSIFDTYAQHVTEMATYAAWLGASSDVNRIRNFTFRDGMGQRTGTVKGIMDRVHGSGGSGYLQTLLADIANGIKSEKTPTDALVGNYKAAAVGGNIRVIIQQPTAMLRALDMIDPQYFIAGLNPGSGWKKAKKYAPIAQWKDWGYFDINTGRQMKDVLFESDTALEKVRQLSMFLAGKADSIAWGYLWNACEAETKAKRKDLTPGTDEFYKAVAERFTEIIDHTQVVDGILQRSQIMRQPGGITKMATAFMGEPTKQYNMLLTAAYDATHAQGDKARSKAKKRLARTLIALLVSGAINAMAQSIIDAMRDDDKEKDYWEKWLEALIGFTGDEEGFQENAKAILDGNLENIINPFGYIPYVKDVYSLIQGYDVARMDMESIQKTITAAVNFYKALSGDGKYTVASASANLFAEAARMLGVPVYNVKRDVKALAMLYAVETNNYLLQYRMEKASLNLNYSTNKATFLDILYNASVNDEEAYRLIYADLIREDKLKTDTSTTAEVIASGMEKRMKTDQGVDSVDDLESRYLPPERQAEYSSTLSDVKSSQIWSGATVEQRDSIEDALYDLVMGNSTGEKLREKIDGGASYGIDETDYLLYKLALSMTDHPSESGKLGSYTNDEVEAAIEMLTGLSNEARGYLWEAQGKNEKSNPWG